MFWSCQGRNFGAPGPGRSEDRCGASIGVQCIVPVRHAGRARSSRGPALKGTSSDKNLALPFASRDSRPEGRASFSFRPIHYLGSKLRLTETITDVVESVAAPNGIVC